MHVRFEIYSLKYTLCLKTCCMAFVGLGSNKLRSILKMLGHYIGVASVIVYVSLGKLWMVMYAQPSSLWVQTPRHYFRAKRPGVSDGLLWTMSRAFI